MIPFWNHRRIADLLRTRQLSEKQRANFLIGGSALQIVGPGRGLLAGGRSVSGLLLGLIYLAITVWGLERAFRANQAGDGQAFIERFTVLAIPLGLQMWGQALVLYLITWLAGPATMQATSARILALMTSFALYVWFFLRLRRYMALASQQPDAAAAAA